MAFVEIVEKRNILFMGPVGAGKTTILHKLTGTNSFEFTKGMDGLTRSPEIKICEATMGSVYYRFILADTSTAADNSSSLVDAKIEKVAKIGKDGFNLILIVLRKGLCTEKDLLIITKLLKSNFSDSLSKICAIVHTGCEDIKNKDEFLQEFRSGDTALKLSSLAEKGEHCVGFPDIKAEESLELQKKYTKSTENDKTMLENLIANSDQNVQVSVTQHTTTADGSNGSYDRTAYDSYQYLRRNRCLLL